MQTGEENIKKIINKDTGNITDVDVVEVLQASSDNSEALSSLLQKQKQILTTSNVDVDSHIHFRAIDEVACNPNVSTRRDFVDLNLESLDFGEHLESEERSKIKSDLELEQEGKIPGVNYDSGGKLAIKLDNYYVGGKHFEDVLPELLNVRKVTKVLILSDTAYTRHLKVYRKLAETLHKHKIPFVEYTNIQPNLNRELLFNITEFAYEHDVNAVFVVGCDSTIDLAKLLLTKLLKPNSFRLVKANAKPIISSTFTVLSFPTIVVPERLVNQHSLFDNSIFFKSFKSLGDTIFFSHPIDNADGIFYHSETFADLEHNKQLSILHEIFFRLIFNYFDEKSTLEMRKNLIGEIKTIIWYLDLLSEGKTLNTSDFDIILTIRANSVSGLFFIDSPFLWTWYKMEASLSYLVNSDKSRGLALFLPSFLEYLISTDKSYAKRATELAALLYNCVSSEGLIYNLIKHNEKFKLPTKLLDITEIKNLNHTFMMTFVKNASNYFGAYKAIKAIVKNLAVW